MGNRYESDHDHDAQKDENPNRGLHEFGDGIDNPEDTRAPDVVDAPTYDTPPFVLKRSRLKGGRHYKSGDPVTVAWWALTARRGRVLYKEVRDSGGHTFKKYGTDGAHVMSTDAFVRPNPRGKGVVPYKPGVPLGEQAPNAINRVLIHEQDNNLLYEFTPLQWLDAGHPDNRTVNKSDSHTAEDEQRVVDPKRSVETWTQATKPGVLAKNAAELRAEANDADASGGSE